MGAEAFGNGIIVSSVEQLGGGDSLCRGVVDFFGGNVSGLEKGDVIYFSDWSPRRLGEKRVIEDDQVLAVERFGDARYHIFREVDRERDYQDKKWGGADHDDNAETEESFAGYVAEYATGSSGRTAGRPFRERMLKAAALAVAGIESHDRKKAGG